MSKTEVQYREPMTGKTATARPTLGGHLAICRVDHWFKNVFIFPGIVAAIGIDRSHVAPDLLLRTVLGVLSICLVASAYSPSPANDSPRVIWTRPVTALSGPRAAEAMATARRAIGSA